MRKGQKVQLKLRYNGETRIMHGKVEVLDGKQAWVKWDDGRLTRVFACNLEVVTNASLPGRN